MTVCIAMICGLGGGHRAVICASDRMLTVGEQTEYEPPVQKFYGITEHAIVLIAGDTASQFAFGQKAQREILKQGLTRIEEMAAEYASHFGAHRRREAERHVLAPLGLNLESFRSSQRQMAPEAVAALHSQLQGHALNAAAIVAGTDETGAHIFTIRDPGIATCNDREGFACVGIGAQHASSELMFAGYHPDWFLPEALLLLYAAKKRAEVAPGVGQHTDLAFAIPRQPARVLPDDWVARRVDEPYRTMRSGLDAVKEAANKRMRADFAALVEAAAKRAPETEENAGVPETTDGTHGPDVAGADNTDGAG